MSPRHSAYIPPSVKLLYWTLFIHLMTLNRVKLGCAVTTSKTLVIFYRKLTSTKFVEFSGPGGK